MSPVHAFFASGRSIVTVVTWPSRSTRRFGCCSIVPRMPSPPCPSVDVVASDGWTIPKMSDILLCARLRPTVRRGAGAWDDVSADDWESTLADLSDRRVAARAMGGEERLTKHRAGGKLDVRARVDHLLDPGSFQELGTLVGGPDLPADAIVMGSGRIDGRPVMVAAEDFTVKAGTISQASNSKRYRVAEIAVPDRVPLVMMLEGAGYPRRRARARAHSDRPARAGALLGPRAPGDRGARCVRRARRAGRADVGLRGDERARVDLHGRSAGGVRVARARRSPRKTSAARRSRSRAG